MSPQVKAPHKSFRDRLHSLVLRLTPTERQRPLALTLISGALCGLAAVAFHVGIIKASALLIDRALAAPRYTWIYWTILTLGPRRGGQRHSSSQGFLCAALGPRSFSRCGGKFVLGIIQIGSGGSLGREGPTVQICAGVSSLLARVSSLSKQSQRRMASVGVAAGIAAAFNAPIAAVTFTVEEIVGDLDQTVLTGIIIAAAIAAAVERSILGQHPVFEVQRAYTLGPAISLLSYAVLGLLAAIVSVAFTESLLGLRAWFKRFNAVPKWVHPAIGGAMTGALAVAAMLWLKHDGITGGGYGTYR